MPNAIPPVRRVCLLRLSALGDVALTLPALDRVLALPGLERAVYVTSPGLLPLFAGFDDPRLEILPLPKPAARDFPAAWRRLRGLGRFDAVLAMQASLRANLLYPALSAPVKVGFDARRVHDVRNVEAEPAVSVHAYSPPLTSMTFYDLAHGRLVASARVLTDDPETGAPARPASAA